MRLRSRSVSLAKRGGIRRLQRTDRVGCRRPWSGRPVSVRWAPVAEIRPFVIAHLSDLHCGSPYFVENLLQRAIMEINALEPDVVVCSGDLTTFGYKQEYRQAREYLGRLECPDVITVPGNHDSRNVGHVHFEELIGPRSSVLHKSGITFVAVDSSEPDLDNGTVGRGRYAWRLEDLFVVNAGTVSSLRLRGHTRPCYNIIEVGPAEVGVYRKYPFHGRERLIRFSPQTAEYEKQSPPPHDTAAGRT